MITNFVIFLAGLAQGIALVALPAASTIVTSPSDYAFSSTNYGSLFLPQCFLSILAAFCNPLLTRKLGLNRVFQFGIAANLTAMLLLALSAFYMHNFPISFAMLLLMAGSLGLGFGLLVPTLNEMLSLLYPAKVNSMLLILNALLGIGTALAPVLILFFLFIGFWWGLPLCLCILFSSMLIFCTMWKFPEKQLSLKNRGKIPRRFYLFAAFALLYGIIETLNGNWISIYMEKHMGAPMRAQLFALTAFWAMVTLGRLFFALIKQERAFAITPFIAAVVFIIVALLPSGSYDLAIVAFGVMGFSCSLLLPLIISFGVNQLKGISSSVPGLILSCYLMGYGIAAFGVGPLEEKTGIALPSIYIIGAGISFVLGLLAIALCTPRDQRV